LNGLYDAKLDHQPVLAIVGQPSSISLGSSFQQEIDLVSLFKDVAHEYVQHVSTPAQVRHVLDRAVRVALSERTVTCLIVEDDLPFVTGSVGWLGTAASNEMMAECDTLLMVGTGMPYTEFLPPAGQARAVQIDLSAAMLGLRYPVEVGLVGDAAATLTALRPM